MMRPKEGAGAILLNPPPASGSSQLQNRGRRRPETPKRADDRESRTGIGLPASAPLILRLAMTSAARRLPASTC